MNKNYNENHINQEEISNDVEIVNEPPQKKFSKFLLVLFLIFASASAYFGKQIFDTYSQEKFFKGVYINGINCENLTIDEVERKIKTKVENYELSIKFRDNEIVDIKGQNFDYHYVSNDKVKNIQKNQKWYKWFYGQFKQEEYEIDENYAFDEKKLKEEILSLEPLSAQAQIAPKDAYIMFQNNQFIIVKEEQGKTIDKDLVCNAIINAVKNNSKDVDIEKIDAYSKPTLYSDSDVLIKELDNLNRIAKISITLELCNNTTEILDGNILKEWLNIDNDGNYYFDEADLISELKIYVKNLAKKADNIGRERTFKTTLQGTKIIKGGSYGFMINQKSEVEQLKDDVMNQRIVSREPKYLIRELGPENDGIGTTYVEIDMTNQRVWFYIDGELYLETPCVTGTFTNLKRRTPGGTYYVYYLERNRVLRGQRQPDGTFEYESPVSYWMPFNKGIGLHDATWRGRFGGKIFLYSGSHGCINMPSGKAAAMYKKMKIGIPVVAFY
ncbi:L,D-transpeptidase family protein [Fusobacterium sp. PH5-44]|uniref:L,D-transpeptidase family protein n=1 Tax=unclassified Fusobacterium TaxID=2648384 RepID=UPI003D240E8A